MQLKPILKKIKGGALTINEEEAFAVARSWLARDLYLARQQQELEPENDDDTLRIMEFDARAKVNELREELAKGRYEYIKPYVSGYLKWHGIALNPDRSVVAKRLMMPFLIAQIEAYRNFEWIIFNNFKQVEPLDKRFADITNEPVITEPIDFTEGVSDLDKFFPPDVKWKDITFTIISNDAIKVTTGDKSTRYTFAEMGFKDGRKGDQPNGLWTLLINGFGKSPTGISWSNNKLPQKQINKLKTDVGRIRKALKVFTKLTEDPFYPYQRVKAYKPKFKIIDQRLGEGEFGSTPSTDYQIIDSTRAYGEYSQGELTQMANDLRGNED